MLYLFYGDDEFGMREALVELRSRLDADGSLETNTSRLNGREASLQEVLGACNTVPFLGDTRLVIVDGLLAGTRKRGGRKKAAAEDDEEPAGPLGALLEYLPGMPPSTTLVLIESGTPEVAKLAKFGEARQFTLPQKAGVVTWIRERAKKRGVQMEPRAMSMLADFVGSDLWRLSNEIDKLGAYADGETVRAADVQALVVSSREEMFWILTDAIGDGKAAQALKVLQTLRAQNQEDQALIGSIRSRLTRLAIARSMLDEGAREADIGRRLGSSGYALTRLVEQASRWPMNSIRAAFGLLVQAEVDVKTGVLDQEVAMELAVHDVAGLSS